MSDSYEFENNAIDGESQMGSFNHSLTQSSVSHLLRFDERFTVLTELSLDISQHDLSEYNIGAKDELKPDVCAYLEPPTVPETKGDIMTVSQMPNLVIEILSPRQSIDYLIRKLKAFFALGVKSCWLVNPGQQIVTVYSRPNQHKTFDIGPNTELIDEVMGIRLPVQKIFS